MATISNLNVKRPVVEEGIIIQKYITKAREAGEYNGRSYEAKPETSTVKVVSSYLIDDNGFADPIILDYEVDESTYKKLHYLSKVKVKYLLGSVVRDGKQQNTFEDKQILSISNS